MRGIKLANIIVVGIKNIFLKVFCFAVMDLATTTEVYFYKIRRLDKQKSGKEKIC